MQINARNIRDEQNIQILNTGFKIPSDVDHIFSSKVA